jgi:hypothetical protein
MVLGCRCGLSFWFDVWQLTAVPANNSCFILQVPTTTATRVLEPPESLSFQIDNRPTKQYGTIANILDQGMSGCAQV